MTEKQTLEEYISKAIENAEEDRSHAIALLSQLEDEMEKAQDVGDHEKHERAGSTAEKYLKAIQRSNDQIIKIIKNLRLLQEQEEDETSNPSSSQSIYDEIQDTDYVLDEEELEVEEEDGG